MPRLLQVAALAAAAIASPLAAQAVPASGAPDFVRTLGPVRGIALGDSGTLLVVGRDSLRALRIDGAGPGESRPLPGAAAGAHAYALSPDGRIAAWVESGTEPRGGGRVTLTDSLFAAPPGSPGAPAMAVALDGYAASVHVAAGGRRIAVALRPRDDRDTVTMLCIGCERQPVAHFRKGSGIRVYSPSAPARPLALRLVDSTEEVTAAAFSADAAMFAAVTWRGAYVWRLPGGERELLRLPENFGARTVAFMPGRAQLLLGGGTGQLMLLDLATGGRLATVHAGQREFSNRVEAIAVARDRSLVVTGHGDGTIRWWDARAWSVERTARGDSSRVRTLLLADAGRLVSLGSDGTLRGWPAVRGPTPPRAGSVTAGGGEARRLSQAQLVVQVGHPSIDVLAISDDGRLIATGENAMRSGSSGVVKLWDVSTGLELRSLAGLPAAPRQLRFSPDGARLLGATDGHLRVWRVADGASVQLRAQYDLAAGAPAAFDSAGQRVRGRHVRSILEWNADNAQVLDAWEHASEGLTAAVSAGWAVLNTGGDAPGLRILDLAARRETGVVRGLRGLVYATHIEPRQQLLASCDSEGQVVVAELRGGRVLDRFALPRIEYGSGIAPQVQPCGAIASDAAGKWLIVSGSRDILLWERRASRVARTLQVRRDEYDNASIGAVVMTPDERLLVVGMDDGRLLYVDLPTGRVVRTIRPRARRMEMVALDHRGDTAVTLGDDAFLRWNLRAARLEGIAGSPRRTRVSRASLAQTLRRAVAVFLGFPSSSAFVADFPGDAADTAFATRALPWAAHADTATQALSWATAIAEDGSLAATAADARTGTAGHATVHLWDAAQGTLVRAFPVPLRRVRVLAVSARHGVVVAAADSTSMVNDQGSTVAVWRTADGQPLGSRTLGTRLTDAIGFTGDGRVLAAASGSRRVTVFDAISGDTIADLALSDVHAGSVEAIAFNPDATLLAVTYRHDGAVRLWDVATGALRAVLEGHLAPATTLAFSGDGRRLLSGSPDATSRLWDVERGEPIVWFASSGQREHVVATATHHYTASRDGAKAVAFRLGDRALPMEQFDLRFNRPDLVLAALGEAGSPLATAYRAAWQRRLARVGVREEALGDELRLPTVAITAPLPVSTADTVVRVPIEAADTTVLLDRLEVFVNDVPLGSSGGIDLRPRRIKRLRDTLLVPLAPGPNKIQVAVRNAAGQEAIRATAEVAHSAEPRRELHVVVIGVSGYRDERFRLAYAAKDARDLAAFFAKGSETFARVHVDSLLDGEATRERILAVRERLMRTRVGDHVVLFVAGHGLLDVRGNYFFAPADMVFEDAARRGVSYEELEGLLDGIPARRKLLLMDTCHAGELDRADVVAVSQRAAVDTAGAGGGGARGIGAGIRFASAEEPGRLLAEMFPELRRGSGATVIGAAGGREMAAESSRWRNGAFTFALREALEQRAADADRDRRIRVSELRDYVARRVGEITNGSQRPVLRRENLADDFPVF